MLIDLVINSQLKGAKTHVLIVSEPQPVIWYL